MRPFDSTLKKRVSLRVNGRKETSQPLIYLASKSPRRKELLKQAGIPFSAVKSRYQETMPRGVKPRELVLRHARGKASRAILPRRARLVLGADTVVVCRGRILGKPKDKKEALAMLTLLSGKKHDVYTGIALYDRHEPRWQCRAVKTGVYFKKWKLEQLKEYIRRVNTLDKAGAYAIQARPKIVRKIKGSYSNVVGLPLEVLKNLLKDSAISVKR